MTLETLLIVLATLVVFLGGVATGYNLYKAGHRQGVTLVDRIKHDLVPFDDSEDEELVQTYTDGTYEDDEQGD